MSVDLSEVREVTAQACCLPVAWAAADHTPAGAAAPTAQPPAAQCHSPET